MTETTRLSNEEHNKKGGSSPQLEPAAVWMEISDLKPWPENPRKNDSAVKKVAALIKRFGFGAPVLARKANHEIIAGHTRVRAAISLGISQVPVRLLDLDPAEAHLLALADNKANEFAEWDSAQVAVVLSAYSLTDAALAGFDSKALDKAATDILDASEKLGTGLTYSVVISCESEEQQAELLGRFEAEGLSCKPLIS